MAKQTRKPVKSPPVTSNPLFPAVVALWFGALFGLGSLAVRPTLIEGLVIKSRIDLIIPATAPPLGVTARILIALVLAMLGAVLGIMLARRLARPKVTEVERKRGTKDLSAQSMRFRARDAHPDAPARTPISAHEELGSSVEAPGLMAMRRRGLTVEPESNAFVPHDMAPLPGGAPQILDLAKIDLGAPAVAMPETAGFESTVQPSLDAPQPNAVQLDWANAAPAEMPAIPIELPAAIAAQRQVFQPEPPITAAAPLHALDSAAVHADGRQVFGMAPQPGRADRPRQIFGEDATNGHVSQDFVKSAGYQTTVFDVAEPSPLFAPRDAAPAVAEMPAVAEPISAAPLPSPANLGMTDLSTRLAEAMARRRTAAASVNSPEPIEPATPAQPDQPVAAPLIEAETSVPPEPANAIPAAYEPAAPAPEPTTAAAIPIAYEPAAAPTIPDIAAPAARVPDYLSPAPEMLDMAAPPAPPAAELPALPNAMRPLALDAFLEEDATLDPGLLPPRHIAMPSSDTAASAPLELVAAQISDNEAGEAEGEENYGSLLGLTPARNPFVRVEDPEAEAPAAEPVVIFPGQAPRSIELPPRQLAAVATMAAPGSTADEGAFRRFDAPSSAGQGQPLAAADNAASAVDPAEAERALRAALSNLQRMSGAA